MGVVAVLDLKTRKSVPLVGGRHAPGALIYMICTCATTDCAGFRLLNPLFKIRLTGSAVRDLHALEVELGCRG